MTLTRTSAKNYFLTGLKPTQGQFAELFEGIVFQQGVSAQFVQSNVSAQGQWDFKTNITVSGNAAIGGTLGIIGVVTGPTAVADTNTTQLATTAFVLGQSATQTEQEAVGSTTKFVSPGTQAYHPSAAKGWVKADTGTTAVIAFNVTSITDGGSGNMTVNWATDFSTANHADCATCESGVDIRINIVNQTAGTTQVQCRNTAGANTDPTNYHVIGFGDY